MDVLHLGYVYKNIEKQVEIMKSYSDKVRISYFSKEPVEIPANYKGQDSKVSIKLALCQVDKLGLGIILWLDGESPYKVFIEQGNEGLHHIAFSIEDIDSQVERFQKYGFEILFIGKVGNNQVVYMDTKKILGIIIEFFGPVKK